jgi:hypothetical protein
VGPGGDLQHCAIENTMNLQRTAVMGTGDHARSTIFNFPNKLICHGASTRALRRDRTMPTIGAGINAGFVIAGVKSGPETA